MTYTDKELDAYCDGASQPIDDLQIYAETDFQSQSACLRRHLLRGHSITPMQALRFFGCFRLSARIAELRNEGMDIETTMVRKGKKRFAKYSLKIT